ncbi:MAG: hypothetical protein H7318_03915 [Oligoflexus sp.]|nr:hypothetical protein [Oligoflexus sp.]
MKITKTLAICLPLLAVVACGKKSHKNNPAATAAPTADLTAQTATAPADTAVAGKALVPTETTKGQDPANQSTPDVNQNAPTPTKGEDSPGKAGPECETVVIDFEKRLDGSDFHKGEKLKDQYSAYGITFLAHKRLPNGQMQTNVQPILFDTAERPNEDQKAAYKDIDCRFGNCDGFDWDLTTEKNSRALIIAEHTYDINPSDAMDFVSFPDDNAHGGVIKLFFAKPTALVSMDLIDVESSDSNIELFNKAENGDYIKKSGQPIPAKPDAAVQMLSVDDHSYVDKLMINLSGSGAVDNIKICVKK